MLSRVADALFWTGRYLERASNIARAVDITFHLDLDLHGVLSSPVELEWNALLSMLRQPPPPQVRDGESPVTAVCRWLLLDMANTGSVMACVNRARNNARSIRGSISTQMCGSSTSSTGGCPTRASRPAWQSLPTISVTRPRWECSSATGSAMPR